MNEGTLVRFWRDGFRECVANALVRYWTEDDCEASFDVSPTHPMAGWDLGELRGLLLTTYAASPRVWSVAHASRDVDGYTRFFLVDWVSEVAKGLLPDSAVLDSGRPVLREPSDVWSVCKRGGVWRIYQGPHWYDRCDTFGEAVLWARRYAVCDLVFAGGCDGVVR